MSHRNGGTHPAGAAATGVTPAETPSGGRHTVLLVDDDDLILHWAGSVLRMWGFEVLTARHAEDAIRLARRHPRPIHVLITDVVMPGAGGPELAEQVLKYRQEARVLYMSGYMPDPIGRRNVTISGAPFLAKPFKPLELIRAVKALLEEPPPTGVTRGHATISPSSLTPQ